MYSDSGVVKLPPVIEIWNKIDLLQTNNESFLDLNLTDSKGHIKDYSRNVSLLKDPEYIVPISAKTGFLYLISKRLLYIILHILE